MTRSPPEDFLEPEAVGAFAPEARKSVYDCIALRRDIRHFKSDLAVDEDVVERILGAAHLAPSVGFSQPWAFIVVRDRERRGRIRDSFLRCREAEAARYPPGRREKYLAYRLEGILDAPVNICVAVDLRDRAEAILGTTAQPEAVRASALCAVQNLWLAARAEGIGVGWVSIVEPAVLRAELALPAGIEPVAYLCLGHPVAFRTRPLLEETGWDRRRGLSEVRHAERWTDAVVPRDAIVRRDAVAPEKSFVHEGEDASLGCSPEPAAPVPLFSEAARDEALAHHARLVKPAGSLGRLEQIAGWYAGVRGSFPAAVPAAPALLLFAADHGVVVEGVSAYGSQTTAALVATIMAGGAAVNALAAQAGARIHLVDVGVAGDLSCVPRTPVVPLVSARVRAGTGNLRREPAMLRAEAQAAIQVGERVAAEAISHGADLIALGEAGIGNTTSAAALICALTGAVPEEVVGLGSGIAAGLRVRKVAVVLDALALHRPLPADPVGVLAALGGLELAALAGAMIAAARRRIPVVLDGFLCSAAALVAVAIEPAVGPYLLASHASAERGAGLALQALRKEPLFDLGLRLGEGTGALLGVQLVRAAIALQLSMATFATAGIVGRAGTAVPSTART